MKRIIALVITLFVAFTSMTVTGCSKNNQIDSSKTQLYVGNYNGGVGQEWLNLYKEGFENLLKDEELEPGKKGVQVLVNNNKATFSGTTLLNNTNWETLEQAVIFSEGVKYYEFIENGWLADITDIVENPIGFDNETAAIADKLTEEQKAYYKEGGSYYAIPHYNVYPGIVYDIDLFNDYGLYITDSSDGNVTFGGKQGDSNLTAGPDGKIETTYDNGLPATFDEFFALCDEMIRYNDIIPICWSVNNNESYSKFIIDVMIASCQGAEQAESRYTITETGSEVDMVVGFDGSDKPIIEKKLLSQSTIADVNKMSGVYYAHDFMYKLIKGNDSLKYYYSRSFEDSQSKDMMQNEFLKSYIDSSMVQGLDKPIAMMVEGTWWEEEATSSFEEIVDLKGETYEGKNVSKSKRNLGFLPLPKQNKDSLGDPVLLDLNNSMVFVNANVKGVQLDLAKRFIQYISTEKNLALFAQTTGITRDYQTNSVNESNLPTTFSKTVFELKQHGTTVYSRNTDKSAYDWYNNKYKLLDLYASTPSYLANSNIPNTATYYIPAEAFKDYNFTGREYFEGMSNYIAKETGKK